MIFDQIENYLRYEKINKNIKVALEYIYTHREDDTLKDGQYEIIPDQVIAVVVSKNTKPKIEMDIEVHKRFMDIHYILKGQENCGLAYFPRDAEDIPYDEIGDIAFFDIGDRWTLHAQQGEFYAVWPCVLHRPLCCVQDNPEEVRKIICKVKV